MVRGADPTPTMAFTLLELMICIFLLLILMLGLHALFTSAEHSVNAGHTLSDETHGIRAAQAVMARDFAECAADSPALVISSSRVSWFATQQDALAWPTTRPSPLQLDLENNGDVGGKIGNVAADVIPPAAVNFRSHRVDMLSFFARGGPFHRQSGDAGSLANSETSNEAWIVYGHLALPARSSGNQGYHNIICGNSKLYTSINLFLDTNNRVAYFRAPEDSPAEPSIGMWAAAGASTYVGAYAADWMLGRNVILLKDSSLIVPSGEAYIPARNTAPDRQWMEVTDHYLTTNFVQPGAWQVNLTPLGYDSPYNGYAAATASPPFTWNQQAVPPNTNPVLNMLPTDRIQDSRYDLAGTTIEQFRQTVGNAVLAERAYQKANTNYQIPGNATNWTEWVRWWHPLVLIAHPMFFTDSTRNLALNNFQSCPLTMLFFNPANPNPNSNAQKPSYELPETSFVNYRFHANPLVTCPLDAMMSAQAAPCFLNHVSQFIVEYAGDYVSQDADGNVTGLSPDGQIDYIVDPVTHLRRIRWYGMPRCTDGTGQILGYAPGRSADLMSNVVPLRDVRMSFDPTDTGADFEQDVRYYLPPVYDAAKNSAGDYGSATAGLGEPSRYICVWRNDVPSLIRITIKFDDPTNRLLNGQTVEMIYRLK